MPKIVIPMCLIFYIKERGKNLPPQQAKSRIYISCLELNMTLYMIVKVKNVLSCL